MKDLSFFLEGWNSKGVLLIHGLTGVPAEMKFVGRSLHKKGYTVYAPLLPGHGIDSTTLIKTRWQDWLDGVIDASLHLRTQVDRMFSAGICVGGKLGMLAAQKHAGLFDAVALYSACFRYDGWNVPAHYKLAPYFLPWLSKLPIVRHISYAETDSIGIKDERLRNAMKKLSAEGVIDDFPMLSLVEMLRLSGEVKKQLPAMQTPTLLLHAREDDLSSPRHARYIDKHIGAPCELHWLEDSYHMIHVDREYQKVADMTAAYFEKAANG